MGDIGSILFCSTVFPPPFPVPILPPPQVATAAWAVGRAAHCRPPAFVLWEEGGIIFITLCISASRANGKRQSNLLLQGISWLPAGSGKIFTLPPFLGLEASQQQHSLSPTPKKPLLFLYLFHFFPVLRSCVQLQREQQVLRGPQGRFLLAPAASWAGGAARGPAGPRGKVLHQHGAAFSPKVFRLPPSAPQFSLRGTVGIFCC